MKPTLRSPAPDLRTGATARLTLGVLCCVALQWCGGEVVLGLNFRQDAGASGEDAGTVDGGAGSPSDAGLLDAGDVDSGALDSGALDAGEVDAGAFDAGEVDAGAFDAGEVDAGALDAGEVDAGALDAGDVDAGFDAGFDAGPADAGPPDAGVFDAGPPDVVLGLLGPLVITQGEVVTYVARATNQGTGTAQAVSALITLPAGVSFVASAQCSSTGVSTVQCSYPDLDGGAAFDDSFSVTSASTLGWRDFTGSVSTASLESDGGNNGTAYTTAWTGLGTQVLTVVPIRVMNVSACFGHNLTTYATCTPASLVHNSLELQVDGGIESDAGFTGQWGQSANQRNFAFRLQNPANGQFGSGYVGGSTSPLCFQGTGEPPGPRTDAGINSVAWQGCLN